MGQAFYDTLRQSLYRWIRVYDDLDARERIEQMTEWAEGEDDPESYEIPKLEQDLPPCLSDKQRSDTARPLASFPVPAVPWLRELVETTIELQRVSHSMERPKVDEEWLERERSYHSLDLPLPAVLLYFRAGDAVMACFDDECEHWGQETPEPNLIIPLRADDPASVRQALAVIETLMQVLVLTVRIKNHHREPGEIHMRFSIDVGSELELKLYQAVLLYKNDHGNRLHGDRPRRGAAKRRWKSSSWCRTTAQHGEPAGVGPATGDWLPGGVLAGPSRRANSGPAGVVDTGGGAANVLPRRIGT